MKARAVVETQFCDYCKRPVVEGPTCAECQAILNRTVHCTSCDIVVTEDYPIGRALDLCKACHAKDTEWKAYLTDIKDPLERYYMQKASKNFNFFMEHYYGFKIAKFQKPIIKELRDKNNTHILIEIPREHGKSTLMEIYILWYMIFHPGSYVVIFSSTKGQAEERSENIKDFLNETIFHILKHPRKWGNESFRFLNGSKCLAGGSGKQVAGARALRKRPNIIVCDDIVPFDKANMTDRQTKRWFFNIVLNLGGEDTLFIVVGTPYRQTDLINELKKNELFMAKSGKIFRHEALLGKEIAYFKKHPGSPVLWKERWPRARLLKRLKGIGNLAFTRNFLCRYIAAGSQLYPDATVERCHDLDREMLYQRFYDENGKSLWYKNIVGGVDLAISAETSADYFVITVIGITKNYRYDVLWVERRKGLPYIQQKQLIKDFNIRYNFDLLVIESNQYQKVLAQELTQTTSIPILPYHTGSEVKDLEMGLPKLRMHMENERLRYPAYAPLSDGMENLFFEMRGYIMNEESKIEHVTAHNDCMMSLWLTVIGSDRISSGAELVTSMNR
ncbi:MAG: terminase family protein [Thermodesulfobacteriota bacterium]